MNSLFGKKGIDTSYERDLFERRVKLSYPEKDGSVWLPSDSLEEIQRARDFSITNVIRGYENLLERIIIAMNFIETKNKDDQDLSALKVLIENENYNQNVIDLENSKSDIRGKIEYELYTLLFRLKTSISNQIDFQYDNYASQFIGGRSLEDLELAESNSISRLAMLEGQAYKSYSENHSDDAAEDDYDVSQKIIRETSLLHLTNGDISYSHLNRQEGLDVIVTRLENLTYSKRELISGNIEHMIQSLILMDNKESLKTQLLVQFANLRSSHEGTKNKYKSLAVDVEQYASEATYMQKKIKEVATENTMQWLFEQEEDVSESLDGLSSILVGGIIASERNYETLNGSMTQFYSSEANYFATQAQFIQDKEKIRLYFSIIEDLEDKSTLDNEWIHNYLVTNGYESSVES